MLTTRTPEAHAAVLAQFKTLKTGMFTPPSFEGTIEFPGVDGGAEWGGAAFDPDSALLYVNANEMPWIVRLIPNNDTSLYNSKCATCHREDRKGSPSAPSLERIGDRRSRDEIAAIIRQGTGRMPGFSDLGAKNTGDLVDFLVTGKDKGADPAVQERSELAPLPQRRRDALPRSGRLSAAHAAVGHAERDRSQRRRDPLEDSVRRVSRAGRQRADQHRQRQLRRPGRHRRRARLHRRDELRPEVSRLRQAHRHAAVGDDAAGGRQRDAGGLSDQRPRVRRHRLRRRQERRAVRQQHRRRSRCRANGDPEP